MIEFLLGCCSQSQYNGLCSGCCRSNCIGDMSGWERDNLWPRRKSTTTSHTIATITNSLVDEGLPSQAFTLERLWPQYEQGETRRHRLSSDMIPGIQNIYRQVYIRTDTFKSVNPCLITPMEMSTRGPPACQTAISPPKKLSFHSPPILFLWCEGRGGGADFSSLFLSVTKQILWEADVKTGLERDVKNINSVFFLWSRGRGGRGGVLWERRGPYHSPAAL